jgi:Lactate racemase N-terminal domain
MEDGIRLVKIRQYFDAPVVENLSGEVRNGLERLLASYALEPGSRVGITAGSRGVSDAVEVYRAAIETLKEKGHEPFLFASMGSHGRGTAEGQRDLLRSLGVTEEKVGAPVLCSDEVVQVGETGRPLEGLPVYVAREAAEADGVLVINRIKPHTSFHGPYESGLMKMLAVGMGRAKGATMVHRIGWGSMVEAIQSIGGVVLERLPVIGGLAIIENASEETALLKGLSPDELPEEETSLLDIARGYMPSLPVKELDLCVVREMGKNYSGTGMDTNIIGRLRLEGLPEPKEPAIQYLAVLDLSEASHGNATGVGLADFVTERLVEKIDREATYLNCLTSGSPMRAAVPMTLPNDESLFDAVWKALKPERLDQVRMMVIDNTLHLEEAWISENLVDELKGQTKIEVSGESFPLDFDSKGHMLV